jgi:hypothetical protein
LATGGGLTAEVDERLRTDEAFRQQIRDMHAAGTPLLDMVQQLGLPITEPVRKIVAGLTPEQVDGIRKATIEMLDRARNEMPVDCSVSWPDVNRGDPVKVAVVDDAGTRKIQVRPNASA